MLVQYNRREDCYYIEEVIDSQIYHMAFEGGTNSKEDVVAFNIYLYITTKRKQIDYINSVPTMTGKHPIKTYSFCKEAFKTLEEYVIKEELPKYKKMIIYCHWLDNRRRDAYYHYLHRFGYEYRYYFGTKCIAKEFINELPR